MAIILDGTTGITTPDLIDSSLTSGRVVYAGASGNLTGSSGLVFDGTNLGLGVTPSASTLSGIIEGGYGTFGLTSSIGVALAGNAYYNSGWKYKASSTATLQLQDSGGIKWNVAPSGTAGNAITFTQAMTLDASGNLGINTTSPSTFGRFAMQVTGTTTPTNATNVGPGSINLYNAGNGSSTDATMGIFGWNASQPGIGSGIGFSRENSADWGTQIRFYTHPTTTSNVSDITERARITSAGNFGIATTTPANKLTVAVVGNSTLNTPAAYAAIFNSNDAVNGQHYGLAFTNSNSPEGGIQQPQALISCISGGGSWSSNWAGDLVFSTATGGATAAPTEKVRVTAGGNFLVGTTTTNNMAGTRLQTLGSSGIVDSSSASVAQNGTVVITAAGSGGSFTGFLSVSNVLVSNANIRTQTLYAVIGRGTTFTATQLATANGSTSGASFTVTCPSAGAITVTNTHAGATQINMTYIGHGGG